MHEQPWTAACIYMRAALIVCSHDDVQSSCSRLRFIPTRLPSMAPGIEGRGDYG